MRDNLFDAVAWLGNLLIEATRSTFQFFAFCCGVAAGAVTWIIANITRIILTIIDSEKMNHAASVVEQAPINNELEILANVTKIKEEALERRRWTDDHTIALNQMGYRLYHECDWSEASIHAYMKDIVESIPGLTYSGRSISDDDDDDDDGIDLDKVMN